MGKRKRPWTRKRARQLRAALATRWAKTPRLDTTEKKRRAREASRNYAEKKQQAVAIAKKKRLRSLSPAQADAIRNADSIVTAAMLRRPTFKVITPQGVRFETLEPDVI